MRRRFPLAAALLLAVSPTAPDADEQDRRDQSPPTFLVSSRTICIAVNGPTRLGTEIGNKLTAWGRLTLVAHPNDADLLLEAAAVDAVRAQGEVRPQEAGGSQFTARVRHRQSGVQVWSTTKGGNWGLSDASGAWAGRAIAEEFVRYFDKRARSDQAVGATQPLPCPPDKRL